MHQQFVPTVTFFPVTFFPTCPLLLSFLSLYSYCYPNELLLSFLLLFFLLAHCYFLSCYSIHTATPKNCYFLSCYFFSYLPTVTFFPVTLFIQLPQRTVTFFPVTFFPTCPLLLSFLLLFFLLVNCYFLSCYFFSCYFFSYLKLLLSFLLPFLLLLSFRAPISTTCHLSVELRQKMQHIFNFPKINSAWQGLVRSKCIEKVSIKSMNVKNWFWFAHLTKLNVWCWVFSDQLRS